MGSMSFLCPLFVHHIFDACDFDIKVGVEDIDHRTKEEEEEKALINFEQECKGGVSGGKVRGCYD